MPSLIAALVAQIASSILSAFSFNSISELAPTLTIAILAVNLANLFSNLITLWLGWFSDNSFLISSIISRTYSLV